MFPVYAFPPTLAGSVIVALAVTSVFYGRRDRVSISFALFCLAWALVATAMLALQLTGDVLAARLAPAAVWLTYVFMAVYILALTGHDRRWHAPVAGVRPSLWLGAIIAAALAASTVAITTDWVVTGVRRHDDWGFSPIFAITALLVHLPFPALVAFGLFLLVRAKSSEASAARRGFLRNNLYALVALIVSAALFAAIVPHFGLPTFAIAFDAFAVIAFFFFGIIANYRFRQVEELNAGLEAKVAERTRDLREAQTRLVQAEKMVALGRLVAGLAHELNTPLGAVRSIQDTRIRATAGLLAEAREGAAEPSKLDRLARVIQDGDRVVDDGLSRIDGILKRLKSFARLDESDLQTVDLNRALDEVVSLMSRELDGARVERRFGATRKITCLSRQINQVFLNVLTNAAQAVDHHGTIRIETADAPDGVDVRIHDDGPGIPAEHRPHVFDPGFTTRGVGVGTGMGLAIALRVVDDHGGRIEIDSAAGEGTCVTVHLPTEPRPAKPAEARRPAGPESGASSSLQAQPRER